MPPLTFRRTLPCSEIPLLRNPVRAPNTTLSSNAERADVTISLARHTVLIDDNDLLLASRCVTRASRDISWCAMELDCDCGGDSEARLVFGEEIDIMSDVIMFVSSSSRLLMIRMRHILLAWSCKQRCALATTRQKDSG